MTFTEIKHIDKCISVLEHSTDDVPDSDLNGFELAINILKDYRNDAQDYYETQYSEHLYCDDDSESKFCF